MIDRFFTVASAFDWITPAVAYLEDFFNGPVSDFGIPANAGWGTRDIKQFLKKYGVRAWGLMLNLNGDTIMFTVSKAQAKWAYYLLQREGVPILYAPAEVVNSSPSQSQQGNDSVTSFDSIFNWLDKLD